MAWYTIEELWFCNKSWYPLKKEQIWKLNFLCVISQQMLAALQTNLLFALFEHYLFGQIPRSPTRRSTWIQVDVEIEFVANVNPKSYDILPSILLDLRWISFLK